MFRLYSHPYDVYSHIMPAALPPKTPLGRLIRDARESQITDLGPSAGKHRMSQIELADILGVQQQTLSRWEAGIIMPPIDRLPALAAALQVDVNEFFEAAAKSAGQTGEPQSATERRRIDAVEQDVSEIKSLLEVIATRLGLGVQAAPDPSAPTPLEGRRRQAPVQAPRRQRKSR